MTVSERRVRYSLSKAQRDLVVALLETFQVDAAKTLKFTLDAVSGELRTSECLTQDDVDEKGNVKLSLIDENIRRDGGHVVVDRLYRGNTESEYKVVKTNE